MRAKLNGTYTVDSLPPGTYKLTAPPEACRIWNDVPVTVSSGAQTRLDLTPANAVVSPAEFPAR